MKKSKKISKNPKTPGAPPPDRNPQDLGAPPPDPRQRDKSLWNPVKGNCVSLGGKGGGRFWLTEGDTIKGLEEIQSLRSFHPAKLSFAPTRLGRTLSKVRRGIGGGAPKVFVPTSVFWKGLGNL